MNAVIRNPQLPIQSAENVKSLERFHRPKGSRKIPVEVPVEFSQDYKEACLVLNLSPKASAALSRRCLQHILREKSGVKKSNLNEEIEEVLSTGDLPTSISSSIDAIRQVGNFAVHPVKSKSSGQVVDVEPGEAEWNLSVLELLFDHYFVKPEFVAKRTKELNKKLVDAGKPKLKKSE